jgi:hypothetical protein
MKLLKHIVLIIIMTCCSIPKPKIELPFESIDYCFYVGRFECNKIYNNGRDFISLSSEYSPDNFKYSVQLDQFQLDTLYKLVAEILSAKLDTLYQETICDNPASISLIIKLKNSKQKYSYSGDFNTMKYSPLYKLSDYINNLNRHLIEQLDSNFVFESKSRLILPPPPPQSN